MSTSPVITWNSNTTPFSTITGLALTGSGSSGAVPMGTTSNVAVVRLYNNFAAAAGIADAINCVLAVYDDATHQGVATTTPATAHYLQVEVANYNGSSTGADTQFYAIGGMSVKHPIPTNSGTIGGTGANYVTINIQMVVPAAAPVVGPVSLGLWLEYNSVA